MNRMASSSKPSSAATLYAAGDETQDEQPTPAAAKETAAGKADKRAKRDWPKGRAAQAKAVLDVLRDADGPAAVDELAQRFTRALRESVEELLQALVTLGQARRTRGGKYTC